MVPWHPYIGAKRVGWHWRSSWQRHRFLVWLVQPFEPVSGVASPLQHREVWGSNPPSPTLLAIFPILPGDHMFFLSHVWCQVRQNRFLIKNQWFNRFSQFTCTIDLLARPDRWRLWFRRSGPVLLNMLAMSHMPHSPRLSQFRSSHGCDDLEAPVLVF